MNEGSFDKLIDVWHVVIYTVNKNTNKVELHEHNEPTKIEAIRYATAFKAKRGHKVIEIVITEELTFL